MSSNEPTLREPRAYRGRITEWPPNERPREKLETFGAEALSEGELLAILLRTGGGGRTAVDLARLLLSRFGSLRELARRPFRELRLIPGMGAVKSVSLLASFELGRRLASSRGADPLRIGTPEDVVRFYQPLIRDLTHEVFRVLLLDSANQLLRDVKVSEGILNSSLVHPREVFRQAILEPAAGVILVHNHPSGNVEPSAEDLQVTRQVVEAGKIIGIPVHDHVILTPNGYASFAERGLI